MSRYRGKYPKSQDCINAGRSWMYLVEVASACPHKIETSSFVLMADKADCEKCLAYEQRKEVPPCSE